MNRISSSFNTASIREGFDLLPNPIQDRVRHIDLLLGSDPIFVGLHSFEAANLGRSNRDTGHVVYGRILKKPAAQRNTTMVLPKELSVYNIIHEFGHILHETINFENVGLIATDYSKQNHREAFAETFAIWLLYGNNTNWRIWFNRYGKKFEDRMARLIDGD